MACSVLVYFDSNIGATTAAAPVTEAENTQENTREDTQEDAQEKTLEDALEDAAETQLQGAVKSPEAPLDPVKCRKHSHSSLRPSRQPTAAMPTATQPQLPSKQEPTSPCDIIDDFSSSGDDDDDEDEDAWKRKRHRSFFSQISPWAAGYFPFTSSSNWASMVLRSPDQMQQQQQQSGTPEASGTGTGTGTAFLRTSSIHHGGKYAERARDPGIFLILLVLNLNVLVYYGFFHYSIVHFFKVGRESTLLQITARLKLSSCLLEQTVCSQLGYLGCVGRVGVWGVRV